MTLSSIASTSPRTLPGSAAASSRLWTAAAISLVLALAAIAIQLKIGLLGDVSWLITVDEKWLAGQIPYVDFVEINPPASLLLYLPAVAFARAFGVTSEFAVSTFGFLCVGASVALSAAILVRAELSAKVGPVGYAFALIAMAVLPGEAFCERDYLAAVYGLPFLALCVARAERAPIDAGLAVLAGVGAGLMACIKPPYVLVALVMAPYLLPRIGLRGLLGAIEYYSAAIVGLIYLASVGRFFPGYVNDVMGIGLDIYVPIRSTFFQLMSEGGPLIFLSMAIVGVSVADRNIAKPFIAVPALAGLGALAAYYVQGKGWLYQSLPAVMFLTLAAGFALDARPRSRTTLVLGMLTLIGAAAGLLWTLKLGPSILVAGVLAALVERALSPEISRGGPSDFKVFAQYLLVAAIGGGCGLYVADSPSAPALARALTRLGPHPTVMGITEDLTFGFPMVRRVGGIWVQRVPSLWITSAVRRLVDEKPDDKALAARLQPYIDRDRAMLIDDLKRQRPDALLVGRLNTRFHAAVWSDPAITAARSDYRLFAINDRPQYPAELWVRKDLIGLRESLPDPVVAPPDEAAR